MIGRKRRGRGSRSKSVIAKGSKEETDESSLIEKEAVDKRSTNCTTEAVKNVSEKGAKGETLAVTMRDVYMMIRNTLDPVTDVQTSERETPIPPVSGQGDFVTEDGQERSFNIHPFSNRAVEPYRQGQIWSQMLRRIRELERQNEVARQTGPEGKKVIRLSKLRSDGVVEYEVVRQMPDGRRIPAATEESKQTERSSRRRQTRR